MDIATHLARHASCVLLDPICAVPAIVDRDVLHRSTALHIGLDPSGYFTSPDGFRISRMVEDITARRVRELGGTGGKVMVYLRSNLEEANRENPDTLRRVIEDFAAEDLLLVVEFLCYLLDGEEDHAVRIPDRVLDGVRLCLNCGPRS